MTTVFRMLVASGAICLGVALSACSSLPSLELPTKKVDYKSSTKLKPLELPPDLTRPTGDDRFVVPDLNPKGTATFSEYSRDRDGRSTVASAPSQVLPNLQDARVERSGTQRWLVVKGEPDQVWPMVRDFWQEVGFVVNLEIPEAGVMETDWAENRAKIPDGIIRNTLGRLLDAVYSTAERDKFRTRLERGQPGTTEVYISHRGMEEVHVSADQDQTKWQPRKADPDLEAEMLRRLMVRFGVEQGRAKSQLAVAAEPARATLSRANRDTSGSLALNEQFDRAWRRVGLALDRVGFTVEDRDRSKGLYFVRYIDPEIDNQTMQPRGGWLSKLKFWGSDNKKNKNEQYRVLVRDLDATAEVAVLDKNGVQEKSETATKILTLLYEQLK
jgi:outer membrane protein assembly factor BamC